MTRPPYEVPDALGAGGDQALATVAEDAAFADAADHDERQFVRRRRVLVIDLHAFDEESIGQGSLPADLLIEPLDVKGVLLLRSGHEPRERYRLSRRQLLHPDVRPIALVHRIASSERRLIQQRRTGHRAMPEHSAAKCQQCRCVAGGQTFTGSGSRRRT